MVFVFKCLTVRIQFGDELLFSIANFRLPQVLFSISLKSFVNNALHKNQCRCAKYEVWNFKNGTDALKCFILNYTYFVMSSVYTSPLSLARKLFVLQNRAGSLLLRACSCRVRVSFHRFNGLKFYFF